MQHREVNYPSIKGKITVSEDGKKIIYKGKSVRLSLVKSKHHRNGYYQVAIDGKKIYVHKLVAEAFVANTKPVSNKLILHKDCNSRNNHYTNLEWGDRKRMVENHKKHGIEVFTTKPETYRGSSKLSYQQTKEIIKRLNKGEFANEICLDYNVSEMSIARIRKRYIKKPAAKRYPKEVKNIALRLLNKHKPHELVEITGLKYNTLYRWSKEI